VTAQVVAQHAEGAGDAYAREDALLGGLVPQTLRETLKWTCLRGGFEMPIHLDVFANLGGELPVLARYVQILTANLFDPFFRGAGERDEGYGLGLAISRRAIDAHAGSISASNLAAGGFRISIQLPA